MKVLGVEATHKNSKRTLLQLVTEDIKQVNIYHAIKGAILGNHLHKATKEYFYIMRGTVIYNDVRIFNKGDFFLVEPDEKHKIECMNEVSFMTFLTKPYTAADPDIHV